MKVLLIIILVISWLNTNNQEYKKEIFLDKTVIVTKDINIPNKIIEHIKENEVYMKEPYLLGGMLLIAYGHAILPNEKFTTVTEKEATKLLIDDFKANYQIVTTLFPNVIEKNKKLALTMLAYNCGSYKLKKWNLYDSIINNGDCSIWLKYCFFNGKKHEKLYQRRLFEYKIFNNEIENI